MLCAVAYLSWRRSDRCWGIRGKVAQTCKRRCRQLSLKARYLRFFSQLSKLWLVLFCIDAKFYKKIFVGISYLFEKKIGKLLTRSTRFTYFCTAQISKLQTKIVNIFSRMNNEFPIFHFLRHILHWEFWWNLIRISRQIPEKSDVCRFFNRICENKLENCRNF